MKNNGKVTWQAGRFLIVGAFATLLHWGIYTFIKVLFQLQTTDGWKLSVAYSAGYAISLLVNYQLSLRYTFRTQGSFGKGVGFVFSHAVNYALHIVLLNLFLWVCRAVYGANTTRGESGTDTSRAAARRSGCIGTDTGIYYCCTG